MTPIKSVYVGMDCAYCQKRPSSPDASLATCQGCRQARYCGRSCQVADWKADGRDIGHKRVCKLLKSFRSIHQNTPTRPSFDGQSTGPVPLVQKFFDNLPMLCMEAGVSPNRLGSKGEIDTAKNFLSFCRVCSICRKTEYDVPAEEVKDWPHCAECGFGWCCSKEHWERYESDHTEHICDTYKKAIACERFRYNHVMETGDILLVVPPRPLSQLLTPFPTDWDEFYAIRIQEAWASRQRLPRGFFEEGTDELSQPVNVLNGMYVHGIDLFSEMKTLTIHIVGADPSYEFCPTPTCIWEEILHCLPNLQQLNLVFVGPELLNAMSPPAICNPQMSIGCCPECSRVGRGRSFGTYAKLWHEYRADADNYIKPDFIVAFNTGMSMEMVESWTESVRMMLEDDTPCLFTSYDEGEAKGDYDLLESLGARILTERAALNPFSVDQPLIDSSETDKFFKKNNYFTCFRGK